MLRRIVAFIDCDENQLLSSHPRDGVGSAFEVEMNSLKSAGITVDDWIITDSDDTAEYARYIDYLFRWTKDHAFDLDCTTHSFMPSPLPFDDWRKEVTV